MTRVHRLQHVECFFAAALTDHNSIRTHTEAIDEQLALADGAVAFEVRGPGFQANHMRLAQLKFGRVFDGDNALLRIDERA